MNSTVKKILIIAIILIAVGFILYPQLNTNKKEDTANEPAASNKLPVTAIVIKEGNLDNRIRTTGSLRSNESVELKSEVSGIVELINFEEGQAVKKGQLLVQLDDDEIRAEIEKLQYTEKLNKDLESRQKQLLEREAISQEEYETALTVLNTIRSDIKVRQVQLAKRRIMAPFDGLIGLRAVSVGSYLNPADNIVTIYSINPIKIDFSVPGKYSSVVNPGDQIEFTTEADNMVFTGEIYAIEPQIDPRTRSLNLRATSANQKNLLLPGQFANISLRLDHNETAIMIPTEAVIPELNGKKVFVYNRGVAESRQIETGIRTADKIQVTSGLSAGDTLLTSGTIQLRQGTEVELELQENE